jgi:hypothetical protein
MRYCFNYPKSLAGYLINKVYKMRFIKIWTILILPALITISGCKKDDVIEDNLQSIESHIRKSFDSRATFTFAQYEDFLKVLSDDKFIVLPLNKMRDSVNDSKVIIGLRHDIDVHPFKAVQLAELENTYGFKASYFILPTASYYGILSKKGLKRFYSMGEIYKRIDSLGAEIGIHNDLITVMLQYNLNPFDFNLDDLAYFESIQIPIYGSAAHGGDIESKLHVVNYEIFSDFDDHPIIHYNGIDYSLGVHSLKEFGYLYEAYHIESNLYFSDNGGQLPGGFSGFIESLKNSKPGDRIQILTHPVWWGK